jgi:hypothetical protein
VPGRDRKRGGGQGRDPRARFPGQRVSIRAACAYFGSQPAQATVRSGDDFDLFLLELNGQHRVRGRSLSRTAQIMEAQDVSCQGQRAAIAGINYQKFFLNTKSTHVLSVAHETTGE